MEISTRTFPKYLGSWTLPVPAAGDLTAPLYGAFNGTHALLADFATRDTAIRNAPDNNDLVQAARVRVTNERLAALANEILGKADRYQAVIDTAAGAVHSLENRISDKRPVQDLASVTRGAQIVAFFVAQDAETRLLIIANSMKNGDVEALQAIMGAPRLLGLVADSVRKAVEAKMIEDSSPADYRALVDLRTAVGVVTGCLENLKSYVRSQANVQDVRGRLISDSQAH